MISRFKISKLFGFRTVDIPFKDDVKILIGENGLGKTTVLNSLYYVLSEKYHKLFLIDFEKLELIFNDKKKINFKKKELEAYLRIRDRQIHRRVPKEILELIDIDEVTTSMSSDNTLGHEKEVALMKYMAKKRIPKWAPNHIMVKDILSFIDEPIIKKLIDFREIIKSKSVDILYFPTYRRVEEDLKNLGRLRRNVFENEYDEDLIVDFEEEFQEDSETLIHFGMEDVERRIDSVKDMINNSTVTGFSKVTGEILSQLLKGFPEISQTLVNELDVSTAKIVLHRVGDSLSNDDRIQILNLLENPRNLLKKKELTYFLFNLIEIYNQHKHVDDAIKKFKDVCNNYLEDKEFRYNESLVSLDVYRKGTGDMVALNKLSSGEKQIISLFSKIYLEFSKNYLVLFDEPELSLSMEWQKLLLPDIVSSDKCKFLLSVTHSPFIFRNELDEYAVGMNAYIK